MKEEYLGLSAKHGVIVRGYGKKVTFTKGYGKYKKKFSKVYGIDDLEQKEKDIEYYCENGWKLASITDVKCRE